MNVKEVAATPTGSGRQVTRLPTTTPVPGPVDPAANRLHFIDGMRALAAVMVFGFHLSPYLSQAFSVVTGKGWVGVEVFFVLSGFVIAHTVGDARITPAYFGSFVLRRSLRLDPPYWIAIAATLALILVSNGAFTDRVLEFPTAGSILAHVFYLQHIAGYPDIVDVFWSLCIEVQLYLVFVLGLALAQVVSVTSCRLRNHAVPLAYALFTVLAGVSLLGELGVLHWEKKTWFLSFWHEFFLGAVVSWVLRRKVSAAGLLFFLALIGAALVLLAGNLQLTVTTTTGLLIYLAGLCSWLRDGLNVWGLQLLGRTSYGFYLIHTVILARTVRLLARMGFQAEDNVVVIGLVGFALSFLGAYLLYRFVETPCVRFGKRFKVG